MLEYAFEEWPVICRALAMGKQSLLIRGLEESEGPFELQSPRFWLKPTFSAEEASGINTEMLPLLPGKPASPTSSDVSFSQFAEVTGVYQVHKLFAALLLSDFHVWSDDVLRSRFTGARPGLYVLLVRVYEAEPVIVPASELPPAVGGWIHLPRGLPTAGATPVVTDKPYAQIVESLEAILNPTARA